MFFWPFTGQFGFGTIDEVKPAMVCGNYGRSHIRMGLENNYC